jgi:hypothetical protein
MAFVNLGTALPTAIRHFKDTKSLIEQELKAQESIIKMGKRNIGLNPGIGLFVEMHREMMPPLDNTIRERLAVIDELLGLTEKFLGRINFPEGMAPYSPFSIFRSFDVLLSCGCSEFRSAFLARGSMYSTQSYKFPETHRRRVLK